MPNKECLENVDHNSPRQRPEGCDKVEDPVVLLERHLYCHPPASLLWERNFEKVIFEKGWAEVPTLKCLHVPKKVGIFLSVYVDDQKKVGQKQNMDSLWKTRQKEVDFEDPTPLIDFLYLGCTQGDAKVDPQAVQSETELFKKLTTTKVADEKDQTEEQSYDTEGHAEKCVILRCNKMMTLLSNTRQYNAYTIT